jgi:hypothetical protein
MSQTSAQYDLAIASCSDIFIKKTKDYGTAWRILRISSITDQIFIKAQRIRTLEEKKVSKVGEDITSEYIGIVNYCVIAMMQIDLEFPVALISQQIECVTQDLADEQTFLPWPARAHRPPRSS